MDINSTRLFQRRIRYQFESFCKKVIHNERVDFLKELQRHTECETNFSALTGTSLASISSADNSLGAEYIFDACGYCISIQNERLIEALLGISAEERCILLLYYSVGIKDPEISELLHTSRSRIQRLRAKAFNWLQDEMRR